MRERHRERDSDEPTADAAARDLPRNVVEAVEWRRTERSERPLREADHAHRQEIAGFTRVPLDRIQASESSRLDSDARRRRELVDAALRLPEVQARLERGWLAEDFDREDRARSERTGTGLRGIFDTFYGAEAVVLTRSRDGDYRVLSGQDRVEVARSLGLTEIPATVLDEPKRPEVRRDLPGKPAVHGDEPAPWQRVEGSAPLETQASDGRTGSPEPERTERQAKGDLLEEQVKEALEAARGLDPVYEGAKTHGFDGAYYDARRRCLVVYDAKNFGAEDRPGYVGDVSAFSQDRIVRNWDKLLLTVSEIRNDRIRNAVLDAVESARVEFRVIGGDHTRMTDAKQEQVRAVFSRLPDFIGTPGR